MVPAAEKSIEMVLTRNDLMQLHLLGLAESLKEAKKRGVKLRIITVLDHQTTEASEALLRTAELRHSEDFAKSRIFVEDQDQVLVSLVLDDVVGRKTTRTSPSGRTAATMPGRWSRCSKRPSLAAPTRERGSASSRPEGRRRSERKP